MRGALINLALDIEAAEYLIEVMDTEFRLRRVFGAKEIADELRAKLPPAVADEEFFA